MTPSQQPTTGVTPGGGGEGGGVPHRDGGVMGSHQWWVCYVESHPQHSRWTAYHSPPHPHSRWTAPTHPPPTPGGQPTTPPTPGGQPTLPPPFSLQVDSLPFCHRGGCAVVQQVRHQEQHYNRGQRGYMYPDINTTTDSKHTYLHRQQTYLHTYLGRQQTYLPTQTPNIPT